MLRPLRELSIAVAAVVCGAVVALAPSGSPQRMLAGLLLILVLPGSALASALLPPAERGTEKVLVALGGSLVVMILVSLAIADTRLPQQPVTWVPVLVGVTVLAAARSYVRRRAAQAPGRRISFGGLRLAPLVTIVAACVLLVGAVALGTTPLPPPPQTPGYTELWFAPGKGGVLSAVVRSAELQRVSYSLTVTTSKPTSRTLRSFVVEPGGRHSVRVPGRLQAGTEVDARLIGVDGKRRFGRRVEFVVGSSRLHAPLRISAGRRG